MNEYRDYFLLSDGLYNSFLIIFHSFGLLTSINSNNQCEVFVKPDDNDWKSFKQPGQPDNIIVYIGSFKVQGQSIHLFKYPGDPDRIIIDDLSDPELYHHVLRYFGVEEYRINIVLDIIFEHRT